jgi:hypothetical protein
MWSRRTLALFSLLPVAIMQSPYWGDELIVLKLVGRWGVRGVLAELPVHQPHFPTWYLFVELGGPYAAEAASVACMPLTVWWTVGAAKELYDSESASLAGMVIAVSPFVASQAGWLRMYAPLTALSALALRLVLAGDHRSPLAALAAFSLHPFGLLLVLWEAAVGRTRSSVHAFLAAAGASAAYGLLKLTKTGDTPGRPPAVDRTGVGHGVVPEWYELAAAVGASLAGSPRFRAGVAAAAVCSAVALHTDRRVALWSGGYVLALLAASALVHPVWELKYLGVVAPAAAVGLADPRSGRWRWAGVAAFAALAALNLYLARLGAPVAHRMYLWFL